jgi:hypothetical protein
MAEDLSHTSQGPKSLFGVFDQQPFQKHFDFRRKVDVGRKLDFFVLNSVVYLFYISRIERRVSSDQFIKQGAETIVIN